MVSQKEYGVHATHCCKEHGCKYGDKDCPVVTGKTKQCYYCEQCVPPNDDYGQEDEVLSPDEEIEKLLKRWEAKVNALPLESVMLSHQNGVYLGLGLALGTFQRPSNTIIHADTKPTCNNWEHGKFKDICFYNYCPKCGTRL